MRTIFIEVSHSRKNEYYLSASVSEKYLGYLFCDDPKDIGELFRKYFPINSESFMTIFSNLEYSEDIWISIAKDELTVRINRNGHREDLPLLETVKHELYSVFEKIISPTGV